MNISSLLKKETINIGLDVSSKEDCLNHMINGMEKAGFVSDKSTYLKDVLAREAKGSTGVGFGIAIPHGKSSGIKTPGLAFTKLARPIQWNSLDGNPVEIVFLIGVPEKDADNEHIKILISISRKLVHEEFRNQLLSAKTEDDILSILSDI